MDTNSNPKPITHPNNLPKDLDKSKTNLIPTLKDYVNDKSKTNTNKGVDYNNTKYSKDKTKTISNIDKTKTKTLTNKDKLFLKNLKENNYNQTLAYSKTYPDSNYNSSRASATVKAKSLANHSGDVLTEITEGWIIDKLKLFALTSKKTSDKLRATELLGKWKALFTEKQQIQGDMKQTIEFATKFKDALERRGVDFQALLQEIHN